MLSRGWGKECSLRQIEARQRRSPAKPLRSSSSGRFSFDGAVDIRVLVQKARPAVVEIGIFDQTGKLVAYLNLT